MHHHHVAVADSIVTVGRRKMDHWFSVVTVLMVIALTVISFGPALVAPAGRTVPLPLTPVVGAHALVASAFLLVFLAQTLLVAAGRTPTHRRLGVAGVVLAILFVVTGTLATIGETRRGFDLSGDQVIRGTSPDPAFLLGPMIGVLQFAVLFGLAVLYRRRPDIHKRLMILALVALAQAPVAHLSGHWPALRPHAIPLAVLANVCFLSLMPAYELVTRRRIHPVSLLGGLGVFASIAVFFNFVVPSAPWHRLAAWVATPVL